MAAQASLTRIVNRAAVLLGSARRVESFDDATPLATAARDVFDFVRDEMLADYPWNFAIARADLAASAAASGDFARAFELPGDCLRLLPWDEGDRDYWASAREGRFVLCDAPAPLAIRYIARIEDPSRWSPGFTAALSAALAREIATIVTGESAVAQRLDVRLEEVIARGKRQDGLENGVRRRDPDRGSGWLAARGGWGREGQYGPPIV